MKNLAPSFIKAQRIANRCNELKGNKGPKANGGQGLFARAEKASVGSLYIYATIGDSWFEEGVTANSVKDALAALEGVKTLNIFINSPGGDVFEGKAIYTQLKRFGATKNVYVDGIAASAATFIAMAGDKIITSPAATWMVHEAWGFAMGDSTDMRDTADLLDMMNADIADIYAKRTKRTVEEMRDLMAVETWMNAEDALKEGFTDEVASYDDETDDEEETKAAAKSVDKVAAVANQTRERITKNQAALQEYKLQRIANQLKPKQEAQDRTSAVKRVATASRG